MISKSKFFYFFNLFSLQNQPSNLVKQETHPAQNNNGTSCDNPNPQSNFFYLISQQFYPLKRTREVMLLT